MSNSIVTVNVTQTVAPTPSTLQQTGALLSQGATTTAAGTKTLLTALSDLDSILADEIALTALSWGTAGGGTVTGSTSGAHGIAVGQEFTIAGSTPAGYNGTFVATAGTTGNVIKYALTPNPGAATVLGTLVNEDVAELVAMATTFFAQGSQQAVYVLELGAGSPATGVAYLAAWITANPGVFYSYLVPRTWAAESTFLAFLAGFEATTSKTYFFITATAANYTNFTALMKCAFVVVEAPSVPATEFSAAAPFHVTLHYAPSTTNKVTPTAFSYLFGVTAYPTVGNAALLAAFKAAGVNYVGSGAEGGISNTILLWGTTKDGNDFTYWYSVDWVQINVDISVANAVINGSNNPANPLYYNQDGIDRLQGVIAQIMSSGVTFGLVLGPPVQTNLDGSSLATALGTSQFDNQTVVNAVQFIPYSRDNPGDYAIGRYAGYTVVYVPARGFIAIIINVQVTTFVTQ